MGAFDHPREEFERWGGKKEYDQGHRRRGHQVKVR